MLEPGEPGEPALPGSAGNKDERILIVRLKHTGQLIGRAQVTARARHRWRAR